MRRSTKGLSGVVALALLLGACGGGDDGGGGGGGGGGGNGASDLPECPLDALEAATGPVEITFWHAMTRANEETLIRLTDAFNESQDQVVVKLVNQTSYDDVFTKYKAGLASGELPDLLQGEDTALQSMIDSQGVLPAQSCVEADDYDLSDHVERVVDYYTVEDVLWPMPFNVSNPVLYYNKQAFEEAGLDPDDPPSSLDEVREASEALTAAGASRAGYSVKLDPWYLEQWLSKAGEPYVNNDNGRSARATEVAFDNDTGVEIFTWLQEMVDDGLALNTGRPEGNVDNLLAIGNENAAMTIDSSAGLGTISQVLGSGQFPNVTLGVAPMPGPVGEGGVLVGGAALYILRRSSPAEQAAAWEYAKYLNEAEQQAEWAAGTGYVPIRTSAVGMPVLDAVWEAEPGYRVAYEQLVTGVENVATAGPVIGAYKEVRAVIIDTMQKMLTGGTDPAAALRDAATKANAAMREYNERVGA